jgi:translation initiation factor IF-3
VDIGKKLLLRFAGDLAQHGTIEGQPRLEGRNAHVLLSPLKAAAQHPTPPKEKPASPPEQQH